MPSPGPVTIPSASNAGEAFDDRCAEETSNGSPQVTLPSYQSAVAVLYVNSADFIGYAHFDKFVIKLDIYGLQEPEAKTVAESFLGTYEAMIGG